VFTLAVDTPLPDDPTTDARPLLVFGAPDRPPTADLAPDQLAAVAVPSGRARIVAPAGSGKTRVLTERARYLLRTLDVPAASLCLVAFNKRAQLEMQARTGDLPDLQVQTLNALALSVLNGGRGFRDRGSRVRTIDELQVRNLIGELVTFPRRANTDPAAAWIDALSAVRLGLRTPEAVETEFNGDVDGFADFFGPYRRALRRQGVVDFDDQIYHALEVLLAEPDTRAQAQRCCRVLLVDEFQDLTPAHLLLIRLLAGPEGNVFAVGDDDQTIYGYSGASPDWLIDFDHYFAGAPHLALEVNYRCPVPVVTAATNLLSRNARRVPKTILAGPRAVTDPDALATIVAPDPVQATLDQVVARLDAGAAPGSIAVLTRDNTLLAPVQVALVERGIPVANRDGARFLDRTGVAAALSWLRLATGTGGLSGPDINRAARRPGRSLSPRLVGWMAEQRDLDGLRRLAGRLSTERDTEKVLGFVTAIERIRAVATTTPTAGVLEFVRHDLGLDAALDTLDAAHVGRNATAHSDDLRALIALGRLHPDPAGFAGWLRQALDQPADPAGVQLATVHKVKGLEWPHVVVHDASTGIFPHHLSTDHEEERRVFHVAITRGQTSVTVVSEAGAPSPFVAELAEPGVPPPVAVPAAAIRSRDVSPRPKKGRGAGGSAPPPEIDNPDLFAALKAWRSDRARTEAVPAYVVANDRTLAEIASVKPATPQQLLAVSGIGPAKLERFGDEILAVVEAAGS
jgi:DNA helicase-2/ATP-dependent DNA helicase PcrA